MRKALLWIPKAILTFLGIILVLIGGIGMFIFISGDKLLSWVKRIK